jgi:hypothetical protein
MGIPGGVGHLTMDLEYPPEPGRGGTRRRRVSSRQFRHHFLAIRPVISDGTESTKRRN